MGVTGALTAAGTIASAGSQIAQGVSAKRTAEQNARIFDAQAQNIAIQKEITTSQYRTQKSRVAGSTAAIAGASGVKFSGSVASSVSQSLYQLGLDESYARFNLEVQRRQALQNASLQRYQGNAALTSGIMKAGTTALIGGASIYGKYGDKVSSTFKGVPTGFTPSVDYTGLQPKAAGFAGTLPRL